MKLHIISLLSILTLAVLAVNVAVQEETVPDIGETSLPSVKTAGLAGLGTESPAHHDSPATYQPEPNFAPQLTAPLTDIEYSAAEIDPMELQAFMIRTKQQEDEATELFRQFTESEEAAFQAEASDSGWAQTAMTDIQNAWENNRQESAELLSLDCRSSRCRLEIEYIASSTEATEAEIRFVNDMAENFSGVTRHPDNLTETNGIQRVVLFLNRQKTGKQGTMKNT